MHHLTSSRLEVVRWDHTRRTEKTVHPIVQREFGSPFEHPPSPAVTVAGATAPRAAPDAVVDRVVVEVTA